MKVVFFWRGLRHYSNGSLVLFGFSQHVPHKITIHVEAAWIDNNSSEGLHADLSNSSFDNVVK